MAYLMVEREGEVRLPKSGSDLELLIDNTQKVSAVKYHELARLLGTRNPNPHLDDTTP